MSAPDQPAPNDRKAAFTGLILGAVAIFVILYGTVMVTNSSFHAEEGAQSSSEATK